MRTMFIGGIFVCLLTNVGAFAATDVVESGSSKEKLMPILKTEVSTVKGLETALKRLLSLGATQDGQIEDVGHGIRKARVLDPDGNAFGIIENPHFKGEVQ